MDISNYERTQTDDGERALLVALMFTQRYSTMKSGGVHQQRQCRSWITNIRCNSSKAFNFYYPFLCEIFLWCFTEIFLFTPLCEFKLPWKFQGRPQITQKSSFCRLFTFESSKTCRTVIHRWSLLETRKLADVKLLRNNRSILFPLWLIHFSSVLFS
jgi:hypothetical protein